MITTNFDKIVEQLSNLTVIEINKLVSILEEKWGVSGSIVPSVVSTSSESTTNTLAVEKENFDLFLESVGTSKIGVIKLVRDVCGITLKESKTLVDKAPVALKSGVAKEQAEELKNKFKEIGAQVELK
jgi:large subunit ribosomal protein L7/L12